MSLKRVKSATQVYKKYTSDTPIKKEKKRQENHGS